ncbi:hypothetical protein HDU97_005329 [Phlyctochytrium planicorne]|nr:hypothetical protein HDU97_005329 [Phlyctochytrium planicorne]
MANDERQPLLASRGPGTSSSSFTYPDPEQQISSRPVLEWIHSRTRTITRRELLAAIFLGTLTATLAFVLALSAVSSIEPTNEVNYVVLGNELDMMRKEWNVKGAAVGVVRNGKLIYKQGFGVRNDKGDPVTERTLFQIASNSKAFTTVALSMITEQGKLDLETPVSQLLPGFEFNDPIATQQANLLDILSHRTVSLPSRDPKHPTNNISRKQQGPSLLRRPQHFLEYHHRNAGYGDLTFETSQSNAMELVMKTKTGWVARVVHWVNDTFATFVYDQKHPDTLVKF